MALSLPGRLPGRVQIAGIIDPEEAELIIDAGADMLGFPLGLRDGREDLSVEAAGRIIRDTAGRATSVCITYLAKAHEIAGLCDRVGAPWVQIHGPVRSEELQRLRAANPGLGVIKSLVVHPENQGDLLEEIGAFEPLVDAFITDTFDPATGRSGATGLTHDWTVSKTIVETSRRPVILAGGLNPDNVVEAIETVRPAAVDAHTGLEGSDGRKDKKSVREFVKNARTAFRKLARQRN